MKKLLLTFVLLVGIVFGLFAQKLTYQAVIRDNNQQLVVNTAVKATVTITFTTGVPYAEEVNGSTNIHGLLSFEFGDGTLNGRDWTGATIAVKVVKADDESTVYVNDDARSVSAVPYALSVNGQSIQQYLTEHNYVDETELDSRQYLTSDSTVITTMQGNIANLTQHTTKSAIRDSVAGQIHDSIADIAAKSHTHGNKDLLDTYNQTNADLADAVAKKHAHDNAAVLAATTAPYTDADSIKLKGIAEGAEVNVQADWNQNTTTADDYIKNKPTIPAAANNATLTIQKNGTSVGTFTADASSDKSINITVPTTTSELTNNSGFITTANVPTNVSQLNNDAGYLTNADLTTLLSAINGKIDSLAHLVDSLSRLIPDTPDIPTDTFVCGTSTVTDHEGNVYNTVQIGDQCWTKENMRCTTSPSTGTNILEFPASSYTYSGKKAYYPNDNASNVATYGLLYNWCAAVDTFNTAYGETSTNTSYDNAVSVTFSGNRRGICPQGWHVPSDAEWTQLENYVGSQSEYVCGSDNTNIAKALSQPTGWSSNTNEGCNAGNRGDKANATGFSAVPAGGCFSGDFYNFGNIAYFWSATQNDGDGAWCHYLGSLDSGVGSSHASKEYGFSVRCLRDASIGGGDNPSAPATMSCEQVMECMGDTLGRLNAKIEAQGTEIQNLEGTVTTQGETIDSLAHIVDSLSNLPHGGNTPATFTCGTSTVKDVDNNEYNTVAIGNQCWMAQNLRTSTNTAGTGHIYTPTTSEEPGYDVETYGRLYDWAAVMQGASSSDAVPSGVQGICPTGWHVPSDAEWTQLTTYVGSQSEYVCGSDNTNIAKALASTTGWSSNTNEGCNAGNRGDKANATGFSAVPAGNCFYGDFSGFGGLAYVWSATQYDDYDAWRRILASSFSNVLSFNASKDFGSSVRCLRDAETGGGDTPSAPAMMSCEQVMECMGDTLGQLNAKIEAQGAEIETLNGTVTTQGNTIDSLAHLVDSLSNLTPGGEPTATFTCDTSTVTDYDGNTYNTVQIGQQCWMKQNLKTTHYSDGTSISLGSITSPASTTTAYRYNPNDNSSNVATYGYLYNWKAVMRNTSSSSSNPSGVQGICPTGWHVPSDAEWMQLTNYVGSQRQYLCGYIIISTRIAKALASTTGWDSSTNTCAVGIDPSYNNATGFSAVPAGYYLGPITDFGEGAYFWSATEYSSNSACSRGLYYDDADVDSDYDNKNHGYSVRCLRDAGVGGGTTPSAPGGDNACCSELGARLDSLEHVISSQDSTINALNNQVNPPFVCGTSTVTDHEGNVYNTVQVGDQCWTKENMRCTTSPSTGTNILEFPASSYTYSGKKAYYPNDDASNVATYGLLYNWNAAVDTFNTAYGETSTNTSSNAVSVTFGGNRRGICPVGWHVPSDAEWTALTTYVGGQTDYQCDGDSLNNAKALASTTGWITSSAPCTVGYTPADNNATGFSAVPAGYYYSNGCYDFGYAAGFWSATQYDSYYAYYRYLYYFNAIVDRGYGSENYGYSVRCLRD